MTASLPAGRRGLPRIWFVDTSSLVTMAVHSALATAVTDYIEQENVVLLKAVWGELRGLKGDAPPPTSTWAGMALTQSGWLGPAVNLPEKGVEVALDIQEELAAAGGLDRNDEHWGESAIIAMGTMLRSADGFILTEDYEARIAAKRHGMGSMSLTRLLHHMTLDEVRTPAEVSGYTHALVAAKRWTRRPALSEADFTAGRLGSHGRP